jgi:hypothetical protein
VVTYGEATPGITRTSNYISQPGQIITNTTVGGPVVRTGTPTRASLINPGAQSIVYNGQAPTIMTQTTISNARPAQYNSIAYQS